MKPTQEQAIAWAKEAWGEGKTYCITSPKHWPEVEAMFVRLVNLAYEAGRKDENEAAIEDARTVGGEAGAEMEKLIRARREQ